MHLSVQTEFESLEKIYNELLRHLDSLSDELLAFKAGPDKWSIVEVVEHLVGVEDDFLKQVSSKAESTTLDMKAKSPDKYKTVIKVMERDVPVDVPDESMEPSGSISLDALLSQWAGVRNKLRAFLGGINSENKDELIYRHPFAGPLDISDTLHFIVVHFDNHMRQIDKIEAQMER
jgi:hypothetical protein